MLHPSVVDALHVQDFCRDVVPNEKPIAVTCQPLSNMPLNECFPILADHVDKNGGEKIIGWAIWERPGVFIEAEFHAIWRSPDGENIDIVPRLYPFEKITFLPDPKRKYTGCQIDNVRKALVKDNDVVRFLFLAKRRVEIMNTGDLAGQHGYIVLPKKLEREYNMVMKELTRLESRLSRRYSG